MDQSVKVDDLVLVQTDTRHGYTVVKVTEVDVDVDFDSSSPITWCVGGIDLEAFEDLLNQERTAIETANAAQRRARAQKLREEVFANETASMEALALASPSVDDAVTEGETD